MEIRWLERVVLVGFSSFRLLAPLLFSMNCTLCRYFDLILLAIILVGPLRKLLEHRHILLAGQTSYVRASLMFIISTLTLLIISWQVDSKVFALLLLRACICEADSIAAPESQNPSPPFLARRASSRKVLRQSSDHEWADAIADAYFVCDVRLQLSFANFRARAVLQEYEGSFQRLAKEMVTDGANERSLESAIMGLMEERGKSVRLDLGRSNLGNTSFFAHYRAVLWRADRAVLIILKEKKEKSARAMGEGLDRAMYCTMSHELRTLLNAVIANLELLEDSLDPGVRVYHKIAQSSTRVLSSKLNDLLDCIQIQNGEFRLHLAEFNVSAVVGEVCNVCMWQAKQKQVDVRIVTDDKSVGTMVGDESRIRQVIYSLMLSAIQLTDWGTVVLHVQRKKNRRVSFRVVGSGAETHLRLMQQLKRASPAERKRRFSLRPSDQEPTELLDELTLEISQSICRQMDSRLVATNQDGRVQLSFDVLDGFPDSPVHTENMINRKYSLVEANASFKDCAGVVLEQGDGSANTYRETHRCRTEAPRPQPVDTIPEEFPLPCPTIRIPFANFIRSNSPTASSGSPLSRLQAQPRTWLKLPEGEDSDRSSDPNKTPSPGRRKTRRLTMADGSRTTCNKVVPRKKVSVDDCDVCHILIVDDNVTNRFVLKELMKRYAYNSIEAKDGRDALTIMEKYVKAGAVSEMMMIFMDLQMPVMNGIQATEAILGLCVTAGVVPPPIIGISSDPSEEDRRMFMSSGIREFLSKPIDKQKVAGLVKKYMCKEL